MQLIGVHGRSAELPARGYYSRADQRKAVPVIIIIVDSNSINALVVFTIWREIPFKIFFQGKISRTLQAAYRLSQIYSLPDIRIMQRVNIFPIYLPAAGQIYQLQYIEIFDAGSGKAWQCGKAGQGKAGGEFNVAESLKSPLLASCPSSSY